LSNKIEFPALFKEGDKFVYRSYHADMGIAGDTDSCYMKLPFFDADADVNEVCEIADEIGQHVNSLFPEFIMDAFNVPEDRKDVIQTDREIISDKSFFLTKKRYAAHVVNKEGKPTDSLKLMGLEIRKSNTPVLLKQFLTEVVEAIIDGKDAAQLSRMVKQFKQEYKQAPLKEIASPSGCNTLKKCLDIFEQTGSQHGFHYTVRASMFYNSMCSETDRQIMPGDKVGVVYIKHPKSKYIAYPVDAMTLPDFMDDIIIDYDKQWEKANKTINNYLKGMGFDIQSRKNEVKRSLFGFK